MLGASPFGSVIRVMLVCQESALTESIKRALIERPGIDLVESVTTAETCLKLLNSVNPGVVLISEDIDISYLQLSRQITALFPGVAVLVFVKTEDRQTYQDMMVAGARGSIRISVSGQGPEVSGDELENKIYQAWELVRPIREQLGSDYGASGKVITIYSPKGGVGKSIIAVSLAILLAQANLPKRPKVALIDLNLQFGSDSLLLGLNPYHSFEDLQKNLDSLTHRTFENLVSRKKLEGENELYYISAPRDPKMADQVYGSHVMGVLTACQRYCDWVIVDTTSTFSDITLAALQSAYRTILVCVQDMLSINLMRTALTLFQETSLDIPTRVMRLVLNRTDRDLPIKPEGFVNLFEGVEFIGQIPKDIVFFETYASVGKLSEGLNTAHPVTRALKDMISKLDPDNFGKLT